MLWTRVRKVRGLPTDRGCGQEIKKVRGLPTDRGCGQEIKKVRGLPTDRGCGQEIKKSGVFRPTEVVDLRQKGQGSSGR